MAGLEIPGMSPTNATGSSDLLMAVAQNTAHIARLLEILIRTQEGQSFEEAQRVVGIMFKNFQVEDTNGDSTAV